MQNSFGRSFGLLDAMTIVLVSAPILAILRERLQFYLSPSAPSTYRTVALGLALWNCLLLLPTLALIPMVLRQPRARLRIALGRPGPAACVAVSVAFAIMVIRIAVKTHSMGISLHGESFQLNRLYPRIVGDELRIGFAVIGAWLMLAMLGSWRPETSWIDRAGRLVGLGWIMQTLFFLTLPWIKPYLPAI